MSDDWKNLKEIARRHMILIIVASIFVLAVYVQQMTINSMTRFLEDTDQYDDYTHYNP